MLKQWQFVLLTLLGFASVALVVTDILLFTGNREAQNDFAARTQYIQESLQLEPLYQGIVRNLAEISAKTNDPQITQLLTSQGISFTVNQPQQPALPGAAAKGKGK